ncbi:SDR family oxidoreductase [Bacillus songklensis]|uniref:SDR family oxidoreductase n=1 Tax=Bacillus songklensis TaxID=1069116 RepID=A0ABV8AX02_9BACI
MGNKLYGKTAIVTGVLRLQGIGAAICKELAKQGADIFFTYWSDYHQGTNIEAKKEEPHTLKNHIGQFGVRCDHMELDLSDPQAASALLSTVKERLGNPHILINNACYSRDDSFEDITAESLDAHYFINLRATTLLSSRFAKQFQEQIGGRIINLTSGQSLGPMTGEISYAITKGAIETLTYTLSAAVAHKGITVNAVNPGPTDSGWINDQLKKELLPRFPFGRIGQPEDTARLIAFLASDEAEWITGQIIHSEGGFRR